MSKKLKESSKKIELVRQKNHKGCGIAAIAMLTGIPYDQVRQDLFGDIGQVNGMEVSQIADYLAKKGLYLQRDCAKDESNDHLCFAWLVHVKVYKDSEHAHYVVLDNDDNMFDPIFGMTDWSFYSADWVEMYRVNTKKGYYDITPTV